MHTQHANMKNIKRISLGRQKWHVCMCVVESLNRLIHTHTHTHTQHAGVKTIPTKVSREIEAARVHVCMCVVEYFNILSHTLTRARAHTYTHTHV